MSPEKTSPNFSQFNPQNKKDWIMIRSAEEKFEVSTILHGMLLVVNGTPQAEALRIVKGIEEGVCSRKMKKVSLEGSRQARDCLQARMSSQQRRSLYHLALTTHAIKKDPVMGNCLSRLEVIGRKVLCSFPQEQAERLISFSRNLFPRPEFEETLTEIQPQNENL